MSYKHILSAKQFARKDIMQYIYTAEQLRVNGPQRKYADKTIVHFFCEPSTRTSCSFQSASHRLGCSVISLHEKASSAEKGESLQDTIRTLACYGDAIVLRHPAKGSALAASEVSAVPIINAGDGNGEHPTQALLDIYTIHQNFDLDSDRRAEFLNITFVGDLKNSRTIHSLIWMLSLFPKINFTCISPPSLELPQDIVKQMIVNQNRTNCISVNANTLEEAICQTDVLYMTRIQKERFESETEYLSTMKHMNEYKVDLETMKLAKPNMILMHPLPRLSEISREVDSDKRAVYFKQVENGVYMRMAILLILVILPTL